MTIRRKTLPALSPKVPAELRPLFAAMAEIIETGEGVRGNKLDRKLTLRDMLDSGLAKLRVPGNPGSGLTQPAGPQDRSVPPRPIGFSADGSFFGMVHLSWDRPQEHYNNHGLTNIYRSEEDNFATAKVVGREPGAFYSDMVRDDATIIDDPLNLPGYYYWITFSSSTDVEGPPNAPDGTFAQPLPDAAYLLGQLSGKLGESSLEKGLRDEVAKISGSETLQGSVAQRLSAESAARLQAMASQNTALTGNIAKERADRIAAIAAATAESRGYADTKISTVRQESSDGFAALSTQIEEIESGLGEDYTVGMAVLKQASIDRDQALGLRVDTITSYAQGVAADVLSQQEAFASATEAWALDLAELYVEAEDLRGSVRDESQSRIFGDSALSAVQQVISAANSVGSAAFKVSSQVFINENEAMAATTEELRVSTGEANGLIRNELQVLTNRTSALSESIGTVASELGDTKSLFQQEITTLAEADAGLSRQIGTLQLQMNNGFASVQQEASVIGDTVSGLSAQHSLKLDVNGYISGYSAYNDGVTSQFAILTDSFWLASPGAAASAVKPFMSIDGKVYIDNAFIREASIEQGKLGPITFGKLTDANGNPITTVGGKLRADMLDVDSLRVGNANISGVLRSSQNASNGQPRWSFDKAGGININGSSGSSRMEIRDVVIKVFNAGVKRVQLGDLAA